MSMIKLCTKYIYWECLVKGDNNVNNVNNKYNKCKNFAVHCNSDRYVQQKDTL